MEGKIKIYLPNDIYKILLKDMELFEFYKSDHSLNRNEFLNRLIVNYYETYANNDKSIYNHLKDILNEYAIADDKLNEACSRILEYSTKEALKLNDKRYDITISMKPTKYSSQAFDYIETFLLRDFSLSGWLRNLFASYTMLSQDKRERIIFKDNFNKIEEAIKNKKMLYFITSTNKDFKHYVSPFALVSSKEELFNYLIANEDNKPYSFRVSRMLNLSIMHEDARYSDDLIKIFNKMLKYGPQFSYSLEESELIKIKLSPQGEKLYEKMYIHRPPFIAFENDIYIFECSISQASQYFRRFGKHALILEPIKLKNDFLKFYNSAYRAYK